MTSASTQTRNAAEALLASVKGIARAQVQADARGRVIRVHIVPDGVDDRTAARNAQSALHAVLGQSLDVNAIAIGLPADVALPVVPATPEAAFAERDPDIVDMRAGARRGELQEAARVAFDTLRAAQSSFHGFHFDGAELVRIGATQYVAVAVRRSANDARYCGAAPVVDSVATASARALMNAVGVAAMATTRIELHHGDTEYTSLKA
ncbi:MAG TPA: hypothetical protein VF021_12700 [Longimicrobiales bacterium]